MIFDIMKNHKSTGFIIFEYALDIKSFHWNQFSREMGNNCVTHRYRKNISNDRKVRKKEAFIQRSKSNYLIKTLTITRTTTNNYNVNKYFTFSSRTFCIRSARRKQNLFSGIVAIPQNINSFSTIGNANPTSLIKIDRQKEMYVLWFPNSAVVLGT